VHLMKVDEIFSDQVEGESDGKKDRMKSLFI
jgi:hypothetical protein